MTLQKNKIKTAVPSTCSFISIFLRIARCCHDCMVVGFLTIQSVPITTNVMSSNSVHGNVYLVQNYVIKFVSDLRQIICYLRVLRFPLPIKHHNPNPSYCHFAYRHYVIDTYHHICYMCLSQLRFF